MKIVFWGNERKCGLTTNMLMLAGYLAWQKGCRITIFELVREDNGVKTYFPESHVKYQKGYLETLSEKQMYYVSGAEWKKWRKKRARGRKQEILSILSTICYVEQNMDMVLINLADRVDGEARKIMWEADIVVVNVKQSESAFETFFARYANLSEHIFFLIGSYFEDKSCDKNYLCSKYRIGKENIGVIPFSAELQYFSERGSLEAYFRKNGKGYVDSMKYYFMKEIEQTIEKIWQMIKKR